MKKLISFIPILILLLLYFLLIFTQQTFSDKYNYPFEYKPIPKELSKQYKAEMEQIIDEEYPKIIKDIDNAVLEGTNYYNKIVKYGYDEVNYTQLEDLANIFIYNLDLKLFCDLVQVTQEKYLGIKYKDFETDNTYTIEKYLQPYFEENKVNTEKLKLMVKYMNSKSKILKNYLNIINKNKNK